MKNIIYILIATMLLVSCEEEAGEITFDSKPMIIVNAMLESDTEEHVIQLRMTGLTESTPLPHANINIYVNGKETVSTTSDSEYYYFNAKFNPGDDVSIKVTSDSTQQTASAKCKVPQPIKIEDITTTELKINDGNGYIDTYIRSFISIRKDDTGTSYYRLSLDDDLYYAYVNQSIYWDDNEEDYVVVKYPNCYVKTSHSYSYNYDIALTNGQTNSENSDDYVGWLESTDNTYGIFSSSFFNGQSYTLKVDVNDYSYTNDYLRRLAFNVRSITSQEYCYLMGVSAINEYEAGYLMSKPPVVLSNITGGTGIFSISTAAIAVAEKWGNCYLTKEEMLELIDKGAMRER